MNSIAALFTTAKIWKQLKCPSIDKWIRYSVYSGILLGHKKEWNCAICDNMDGPRVYYSKWDKSGRERQILYDFIEMWNLKNKTNEQI